MKRTLFLIIIALSLLPYTKCLSQSVNILPKPVELIMHDSCYVVPTTFNIACNEELVPLAKYLTTTVKNTNIHNVYIDQRAMSAIGSDLMMTIDRKLDMPDEGYRLLVTPEQITVVGKDYGGVWNGIQTLMQLCPPQVYGGQGAIITCLPCVEITDYPALAYRGMMLDVARTFSTKEDVMRYIDNISKIKINRFHWHLTDDEGWRVEIKSHPELAEVGGYRGGDSPLWSVYGKWGQRYGGYYTQQDIKEVVEYALLRNVEIIPEIDLPGHSRAMVNMHPEIACNTATHKDQTGGNDLRNVWCASREQNYQLLDDILGELCALFPSPYIHIGGDEVNMSQWNNCPECQALMKREGLQNGHQLEGYFISRLQTMLEHNGKLPAVWNEATQGGNLSKRSRVHGWESVEAARKAAKEGFPTVVMPGKYFYFDMKQSADEVGHTWAGIVDDKCCYSFDFAKEGFDEQAMQNVVGIQAAFWSELYLANQENFDNFLDYQTFPRLCALAEVAWTPARLRNWEEYHNRLTTAHYPRMDAMGIHYRAAAPPKSNRVVLTPSMTMTTSFEKFSANDAVEQIEHYNSRNGIQTTRTCRKGDFVEFTFAQPVECSSMELITGYRHMARSLMWTGDVEWSNDGKRFEKAGELHNGRFTITPTAPIKAVRVVCTTDFNGENKVIIQSPIIVK